MTAAVIIASNGIIKLVVSPAGIIVDG